MIKKLLAVAVVATLAVLVSAGTARADTLTVGDIVFTGTVTGTTATLTVQCTDNSVCGGQFLGDVTLKGFTYTTASIGTVPTGYSFKAGGQNNDAVAGGGGCNGKDVGGAVCWDAPTTLLSFSSQPSDTFTFTSTLTGGATSGPLHVQATWYDNSAGTQQGGEKFAISEDLLGQTIPPPPPNVPEPSSLLLLGSGILALSLGLRRKFGFVA